MNYLLVQINIMLDRMHDVHRKCLSFVQLERNDFKVYKNQKHLFLLCLPSYLTVQSYFKCSATPVGSAYKLPRVPFLDSCPTARHTVKVTLWFNKQPSGVIFGVFFWGGDFDRVRGLSGILQNER